MAITSQPSYNIWKTYQKKQTWWSSYGESPCHLLLSSTFDLKFEGLAGHLQLSCTLHQRMMKAPSLLTDCLKDEERGRKQEENNKKCHVNGPFQAYCS